MKVEAIFKGEDGVYLRATSGDGWVTFAVVEPSHEPDPKRPHSLLAAAAVEETRFELSIDLDELTRFVHASQEIQT